MSDSEKKDKILTFLNLAENRIGFFQMNFLNELVFKESPLTDVELRNLAECILKDGYITGRVTYFQYHSSLTPFLESGGYTGKKAQIKSDTEIKSKRDEVSDQKAEIDLKLAKRDYNTGWILFAIAVISAILGAILFFKQCGK